MKRQQPLTKKVVAMIKESYDQALQMLRENRDLMDKLAAFLISARPLPVRSSWKIFRQGEGIA